MIVAVLSVVDFMLLSLGAVLDPGEDLQVVAALSKRSRTQVYSGRSLGLKGTCIVAQITCSDC